MSFISDCSQPHSGKWTVVILTFQKTMLRFRDSVICSFFFLFKKYLYLLFILLCQILGVARRIFSGSLQTLSCGLQGILPLPGIETGPPALETQRLGPLHHQGSPFFLLLSFLVAQMVKHLLAMQIDPGSIPGLGRSPGEGNGNPLQYSSLENSMDRGAWQVYGVAKSWTQLTHTERC